MKRKLTTREWLLLGVLGILVIVVGYITLFYTPTTNARDIALAETESCKQQTEAAQIRLVEKQRMERELEKIFAENPDPLGLADYDNLQPLMMELDLILGTTENYNLSFPTPNVSGNIVRREISISYTCKNYDAAMNVLKQLHESQYRCMLSNLTVSRGHDVNSPASVSGSIVYFECQTE